MAFGRGVAVAEVVLLDVGPPTLKPRSVCWRFRLGRASGFFVIFLGRERWMTPTISTSLLGSQIQKAVSIDAPAGVSNKPTTRYRSLLIVL
jgi:hypothetical protein